VADVIDIQVSAGIRPYLLTNPAGGVSARWWLRAWNDVREWRRLLAGFSGPIIIHAHTFTAGMAAVRGDAAVVYELDHFVEQQLAGPGSSWMQRSFRAAEYFIFSQSQAVIVPSSAIRHVLTGSGISPEKIFFVPKPVPVLTPVDNLHVKVDIPIQQLTVLCDTTDTAVRKAVSLCGRMRTDLRFLARSSATTVAAAGCELLPDRLFEAARASADIAISADEATAAASMASGAALLAADLPFLRELSPEGEGCLWFGGGEELAAKLLFLASNVEFRKSLAAAGRRHILAERGPDRIGKLYVRAYQYALDAKKKDSGPADFQGALVPARVA
jgi:hypothetical protein